MFPWSPNDCSWKWRSEELRQIANYFKTIFLYCIFKICYAAVERFLAVGLRELKNLTKRLTRLATNVNILLDLRNSWLLLLRRIRYLNLTVIKFKIYQKRDFSTLIDLKSLYKFEVSIYFRVENDRTKSFCRTELHQSDT